VLSNDQEKIKLEEEAISEILIDDTDSESCTEASNFEDNFEGGRVRRTTTTTTASLSRSRTTGCNKWRITNLRTTSRNTNIHPFVRPTKDVKKSDAPHINKDSSPLSVLMFFTEIFHLLVEHSNIYYQQH
jgi:hypothetical protein